LLESIVTPVAPALGEDEQALLTVDYVAVAEYFRDHDFTGEIDRLDKLFDELKGWESKESGEQIALRREIMTDVDILRSLLELGQTYKGREITALTPAEKAQVVKLLYTRAKLALMADD
jgi:hypothetical protein